MKGKPLYVSENINLMMICGELIFNLPKIKKHNKLSGIY
jgi:hypothetical protein